ncbi:MAG: GNAT family N-acetyltransferase [Candidatus Latescibacterota bacterium]
MDVVLRKVKENDFDWLYDLRSQTMSKYINDSGDQFNLETQSVRIMKEYESIKIVTTDNQDIGMLKVKRSSNEWEIIQIQLLPGYQHMGIGTKLIQDLQMEATQQGIAVLLSVLKVNPAKRLYERLGFEIVQEKEQSYKMRYSA